nr:leucine-rich repeat and immunoglobulin-like domain-containing nogo receptor-interacting protein 3 [Lytechinus pictus]
MAHRRMLTVAAILWMGSIAFAQCPGNADSPGDCDFTNYDSRKEIRCGSSNLASIPNNIPADTQILRLELNCITSISATDLSHMVNLKRLTLYNNLISSIDVNAFENHRDLQVLNLKYNRISYINGRTFRNTQKLTELNLDNNILQSLENDTFSSLSKLNELELDGNPLQSLPDGIFDGLTNLALLDISNVLFEAFPSTLFNGLTNLATLIMNNVTQNGDQLFGRDFIFSSVPNLVSLALRQNSLDCLPGSLAVLRTLKVLKLSMNPLTCNNLTVLNYLQELEELHLDHTGLNKLSTDMFASNTNLVFLLIEYSSLSEIEEGAFTGLSRMEDLYISSNNLTTLPNNVFDPLPNTVNLELDNNPWHCDCQLRWIHNWLSVSYAGSTPDDRQPTCASPDRLNGQEFLDIQETEYACMPYTDLNETMSYTVNEGQNFVMECGVTGDPLPSLHWLTPDHVELLPNTNQIPFSVDAECTLTIIRITKEDAGTYSCTGTNAAGVFSIRNVVTVSGTGNMPSILTTVSPVQSTATTNQSASRQGGNDSTLVISIAIVASIVILGIVIVIILVIRRRNKRKDRLQNMPGVVLFRNGRETLPSLPSCTLPRDMTMPYATGDDRYADTLQRQPTGTSFDPPPPYSTISPSGNDDIYQEIKGDDDLYEKPRGPGDMSPASSVRLGHTYMPNVIRQDSCMSTGSCGAPAGYERSMIRDVEKPRSFTSSSNCGPAVGYDPSSKGAQSNLYVAMNDDKEKNAQEDVEENEVQERLPDLTPLAKAMYENARRT